MRARYEESIVKINKAIVVILACVVLGFGLGADKKGITIGIVDLDQAVLSTEEGKAARTELERRGREAESELKPMIEELTIDGTTQLLEHDRGFARETGLVLLPGLPAE